MIRCLDYTLLIKDKDHQRSDESVEYPTYLTNDLVFDDVCYLFNKTIFFNGTMRVFDFTKSGNTTTSFDEYSNWINWIKEGAFGREAVLRQYTIGERSEGKNELTSREIEIIQQNIIQNVTALADENPNVTFYIFFPPYSICYWDSLDAWGTIDYTIDAEKVAIEELLRHENIRLYSYTDCFDLIINLDNYIDMLHYGEWVNSDILRWMKEGKGLITADNYEKYINTIRTFYHSYDYESLHAAE